VAPEIENVDRSLTSLGKRLGERTPGFWGGESMGSRDSSGKTEGDKFLLPSRFSQRHPRTKPSRILLRLPNPKKIERSVVRIQVLKSGGHRASREVSSSPELEGGNLKNAAPTRRSAEWMLPKGWGAIWARLPETDRPIRGKSGETDLGAATKGLASSDARREGTEGSAISLGAREPRL